MAGSHYEFDWHPVKAKANFNKHAVDFEQATEVFQDPLALTVADDEHRESEARWITLGKGTAGQYLLVIHTLSN